jgi:NAD(P) transhydrogenase subunit alpha
MQIGVMREARPGERRVAATPATVAQLLKLGYRVVVEPQAGVAAHFDDAAYEEAGASVGDLADADVVLGVNAPTDEQLNGLRAGVTLISLLSPALNPALVDQLSTRPITALAMDAVPRISRAQSLDVLSSMANIAGYRAVVEAAHAFGRLFTGQVTAAGKIPPAKVLVVGAGVAGLAAVGAAGSLGAIVRSTDPRPEVADQVRSVGGEYLSIESPETEVSATGYAKEMGQDYRTREAKLYAEQCRDVDIVITTALIPGKPAPTIITSGMVASMQPGSVIVDMAAANGGNVEGTVRDESVVSANGVTIIGFTNLAGRLPAQASQLYGTNLVNLLKLMTPAKNGELVLDFDDVVVRSMTVVRNGELTWPPPPVQVSAAPPSAEAPVTKPEEPLSERRRLGIVLLTAAVLVGLTALAPVALLPHLTVFALAIVIGYYVIGKVHHALHTPLMSVTNAISGIIVVGALLGLVHDDALVLALATAATLLASVNIFGGFSVTRRMLAMFARS